MLFVEPSFKRFLKAQNPSLNALISLFMDLRVTFYGPKGNFLYFDYFLLS